MTWWQKRTSERDVLKRTLMGVVVKTELELALAEMRRAFDMMEASEGLTA